MLGDGRDEVVALIAVHRGDALEGEVVALGGAAGEDDLLGDGADEAGDLLAGLLDGLLGLPAEGVIPAGGVAVVLGEARQHRLQHARIDARRGVVVHVDRGWSAWLFTRQDRSGGYTVSALSPGKATSRPYWMQPPCRDAVAWPEPRNTSARLTVRSTSRMRRSTSPMALRTGQTASSEQIASLGAHASGEARLQSAR